MTITRAQQKEILSILADRYQGIGSGLAFASSFQLLVATVLSAQTTDVQVNKATSALFADYPDLHSMTGVTEEVLIPYIRSLGFFRMKARHIAALVETLLTEFDGDVPDTREELMRLPGVGRKTANVVLAFAFHKPAIAVDTHVFRVANRMGLASGKTPDEVERQLNALIPEADWAEAHHWLIWHGRRCCKAQRPECGTCPVEGICPKSGVERAK
ncbi:MAG: endonuclease III [Clostridiales bacterium]|nr:endonuclease III [Clostridiales bacterium]